MGAYNVLFMMDKGVLPAAEKPQIRAAYVAGLFRAMRFGDTDAHGKGAAMQYRYLRDKGGIVWDAGAKRFRIDPAKLDAGIRDLVARHHPASGDRRLQRDQGVPRQMGGDGRRGQGGDEQDGPHPGRHPPDLSGPRVMAGSFETFAALHVPGDPVVLYNIWDVGSALAVVAAGAKALATGSHPVADANGWPDGAAGADRLRLRQCQAHRRCGRSAADGRFRGRLFDRSRTRAARMSRGWRRPARSAAISRTR